jgi:hypothetical protein
MMNDDENQMLEELLESFRFMQKGRVYDLPDWAVD